MSPLLTVFYLSIVIVPAVVLLARRWRKMPFGFTDRVLSLVVIFAAGQSAEGMCDVPMFYTVFAILSVMALIVRRRRKKKPGFVDTVCGVVYMLTATKVFMGLLSLSWLPAFGVAVVAFVVVVWACRLFSRMLSTH